MTDTTRLVDAARGGDRSALEALYARHEGRLLAFIRSRMADELARRVAPEDVLQETLLESTRKIEAFEPEGPAAFYRWLVGIARYKIHEVHRARKAKKRALEQPHEATAAAVQTSPSGRAMRAETALHLHEALAQLPERQARAVSLRYLEGASVAETAEALGCTESAAKSLVTRGMAELSERILRSD